MESHGLDFIDSFVIKNLNDFSELCALYSAIEIDLGYARGGSALSEIQEILDTAS